MKPHILRRVKADVAKDLPKKKEIVIEIELTTFQKQWYRALLENNRTILTRGGRKNAKEHGNIAIQLMKICDHPFLINAALEAHCSTLKKELDAASAKGGPRDDKAYTPPADF